MEIERKFLIKDLSGLNLSEFAHKEIYQDYLYVDKLTAIRKRKIINNGISRYYYTIKTGKKGISVNEIENEITEDVYESLCTNSKYNTIQKRRYVIPYLSDLFIELDVFEGVYEGLVFAEIEYRDEIQAKTLALPQWFDKEISTSITNSDMAISLKDTILKRIEEI